MRYSHSVVVRSSRLGNAYHNLRRRLRIQAPTCLHIVLPAREVIDVIINFERAISLDYVWRRKNFEHNEIWTMRYLTSLINSYRTFVDTIKVV